MTDSHDTHGPQLETARLVQQLPENQEVNGEVEIYVRQPTPNPNPWGNWPLIIGSMFALLIGYCVVTTINETNKPAKERDSWMQWLVDYSVEKQKREGRAPAEGTIGPFSAY